MNLSVSRLLTVYLLRADLCATSATTSYPCPAQDDYGGSCPDLPTGATCSGFVGNGPAITDELSLPSNLLLSAVNQQHGLSWQPSGAAAGHCQDGAQRCNANVSTLNLYDSFATPTVGVCVTPVAAGSACIVGYGENPDVINKNYLRMPQGVVTGIIHLKNSVLQAMLSSLNGSMQIL